MEENLELKTEPNNQVIHTIIHHSSPTKDKIITKTHGSPTKKSRPTTNRKSIRETKPPLHLVNSVVDVNAVGESFQQRLHDNTVAESPEQQQQQQQQQQVNKMLNKPKDLTRTKVYPNFKCDMCGSRYVVNPMRRGKTATARNRATPRHKVDPDTQKKLTLCNACGLKMSRPRKARAGRVTLSEDEQKQFVEEGIRFAKELAEKLNNTAAERLYCENVKKSACGCVQKFICGGEESEIDEVVDRAQVLLDIYLEATQLKQKKCYSLTEPDVKIGLGNGHRKSKEFEDYVLLKRKFLRNTLNFCEKATQKILSYSNNFLHKKMKTDPDKGIRVERQKGKAALGMLVPIQHLSYETCCVDHCVR